MVQRLHPRRDGGGDGGGDGLPVPRCGQRQGDAADIGLRLPDGGFMGLLTFKGNQPTLLEAKTAKNYLDAKELRAMGQLVSGYLDFAERQAEREQPMTMNDWANYLDCILTMSGEQLLQGVGSVSHAEAMEHATNEYRKYKQRTISDVEQDYLDAVKRLGNIGKKEDANEE